MAKRKFPTFKPRFIAVFEEKRCKLDIREAATEALKEVLGPIEVIERLDGYLIVYDPYEIDSSHNENDFLRAATELADSISDTNPPHQSNQFLPHDQDVKLLDTIEQILSDSENTDILFENDEQYGQLVEVVDVAIRATHPLFDLGGHITSEAVNAGRQAAYKLSKTWPLK
jgi:hypothetical protein